jgi:hypothetical protein
MLIPYLEKGKILKENMLEALRDYPMDIMKLIYASYGNGIISGFATLAILP